MPRQVMTTELGTDQEAAEADDPVQLTPTDLQIPSNSAITILEMQRRGAKSQPTMIRPDQISQLTPDQRPRPLTMPLDHHLVPCPHLPFALDHDQPQPLKQAGLGGNVYGGSDRFWETPRSGCVPLVLGNQRQDDVSFPLQIPQRLQAGALLGPCREHRRSRTVGRGR